MLRSAHFSPGRAAALVFGVLVPLAASAQQELKREGNMWSRTVTMALAAQPRLTIVALGPVTLEGGVSNDLQVTVKFSAAAQDEAEAGRILGLLGMRVRQDQGKVTLLPPGGKVVTAVWVKAPRLDAATILSSHGGVDVRGIDGTLSVDAVGDLQVDRVGGDCRLFTGGGDVRAGHMGGSVRCTTRAGRIEVKSARGESILTTDGGDIVGWQMGGPVTAHTGGGNVLIVAASGTVDASTGGGEFNGGVRVGNILGPMRISTAMGSIVASLFGSRIADSLLATANGDITVAVPSNVGVTIRADNELSDTMRRITSEFPNIRVRRQGTHLVAEGPLNGGGPVLQIAAAGGTIYIRRQR